MFIAKLNEKIIGYCTISEKDELPEKYSFSPFIGFVFVDKKYRGNRISEKLINEAVEYAKMLNIKKVYILSGEKGLYEKYGFAKIGDLKTLYGTVDSLFYKNLEEIGEM